MKHGFAQVGRRKDYYDDPTEDAILMTRSFQEEDGSDEA
jgi:ribosomal-protein-alanine N-acetyltransferase